MEKLTFYYEFVFILYLIWLLKRFIIKYRWMYKKVFWMYNSQGTSQTETETNPKPSSMLYSLNLHAAFAKAPCCIRQKLHEFPVAECILQSFCQSLKLMMWFHVWNKMINFGAQWSRVRFVFIKYMKRIWYRLTAILFINHLIIRFSCLMKHKS